MSTYELDDDMVQAYIAYPSSYLGGEAAAQLQARLSEQLPIPMPTKVGAVVRTVRGVAVLADPNDRPGNAQWVLSLKDEGTYIWTSPDDGLGRITEVLSEGVDL